MKKKLKYIFILVLLASAGYAAYQFLKPEAPSYVYRTQPATIGAITSSISATGKVNAVEMVEVGTQVSGTIKEIYVDFNSPVKKGQLLALLDPDVLASRVEESKANLALAQAGVAKAKVEVENASRNDVRSRELWERKLIAKSEMESSGSQLALSRASLAESNSRVIQARESLRQAQSNLEYTKITSPIDGVVVSRQVDVGQTVAASLQTPTLFSIARDLTQMQVEANIDEADIGRISEGQSAICKFDSWPQDSFEAVVSQKRLSPETVSNVVTYVVILKVGNMEDKLMPGMTANISIVTDKRDGVLRIPAAALRFSPPPDVVADASARSDNSARTSGGLLPIPQRGRGGQSGNQGNEQIVWLVEDGKLAGRVVVDETGVSDRTWVELRGSALGSIKDGQELAVAFTKETGGSAAAGTR
ncbi:MAG: efflux RND transporter periplasmic adaptor subunit [Synergistaceae bacterium]|jgi:HlyD family secretion protein|nr:efflux RND transporter periplasmic adaptor subunit [Synergistaceae bacterium]